MSTWSAVLGGANLVYHAAGWMEGGLTASFEKIALDVEMPQMMAKTMRRPDVSSEEIDAGIAAIADVPTGGHFFGSPHTLARYETAFYEPIISDWQNYENWVEGGAETADINRSCGHSAATHASTTAAALPPHATEARPRRASEAVPT